MSCQSKSKRSKRSRRKCNKRRRKAGAQEAVLALNFVPMAKASPRELRRYVKAHELIPANEEEWVELGQQAPELLGGDPDPQLWKRMLIALAHSPQGESASLLLQLGLVVPPRLRTFWELACAENAVWSSGVDTWAGGELPEDLKVSDTYLYRHPDSAPAN